MTIDDLYLLESIARGQSRSDDERQEAARRLSAEVEMRLGFCHATTCGLIDRALSQIPELVASLQQFSEAAQGMADSGMDAMSREERAEVLRRVRAGECQLDAMVIVEDRRASESPAS